MTKWINILVFLLLFSVVSAQKPNSVYQDIGYYGFNIRPRIVDKYDLMPDRIKELTSFFISDRFGDYSSKVHFVHAQIFPVDSVYKNDLKDLKERNLTIRPIPTYDLNYSFKDSALGISQYWINIGMDNSGQVISCNFPLFNDPGRKITPLKSAKTYADSLLNKLYPEIRIGEYKIDLVYEKAQEILIWEFCYLTKDEKNSKHYKCLLINAHYNTLIREQDYFQGFVQFDNCCHCGPEEIQVFTESNK